MELIKGQIPLLTSEGSGWCEAVAIAEARAEAKGSVLEVWHRCEPNTTSSPMPTEVAGSSQMVALIDTGIEQGDHINAAFKCEEMVETVPGGMSFALVPESREVGTGLSNIHPRIFNLRKPMHRCWSASRKHACVALLAIGQFLSMPLFAKTLPDNFFPESIAASLNGRVFVGSSSESRIVEIPAGADISKPFVPAGANGLMSVQGLLVDDAQGILWAYTADLGVSSTPKGPSALLAYHLDNGSNAGRWPLPDEGFCNDITFGPNASLLITDTTHDRIFRFDLNKKQISTWIQHPILGGQAFNGNGIAVDRDNVFVSTFADGRLLRIPVKSDGSAGDPVTISLPRPLKGGDAIRTVGPDRIIIFENGLPQGGGQVTLAQMDNDRAVLVPLTSTIDEPTSGILLGNRLLIVESQFAKLYGAQRGKKPSAFSIRSIAWDVPPSTKSMPKRP